MTRSNRNPARGDLGEHVGRVALEPDRHAAAGVGVGANAGQRVVQVGRQLVEVAGLQPPLDAVGVDLDVEARRPGQRRRERLCAAHPAESGGQHRVAGEVGARPSASRRRP